MHAKTDSEGTSVDTSWQLRSPPRRPVYYKRSYGSSPTGSPAHHFYHCSAIHHSRESSTSRFSASLKNPRTLSAWKHVQINQDDNDDDEMDDDDGGSARNVRLYLCGFLFFVLLFTIFCLILWGASKAYKPKIFFNNMVFENFNVQAGSDQTGVPTDMLSLNSTVKIHYRNPPHSSPSTFTQSRKSQRTVITVLQASQIPLYGGVPLLANAKDHIEKVAVPLNLTFVVRSRAYILGRLVKSKFYKRIRCPVTLHGNKLGKPINLTASCVYH
ncbi:hypothetical protein P3X46_033512 [Hevea brasiliensis]|uniref:Late embryogenesis abundant protein LEA-2 subgroup domain-containing protein n=1 Tax=Hevea brasiliensis TaxID=3981 RepID=A0ABQ9KCR2_HEVBR|nr:hypothetical protein P3X46_033512 [Hevea brasiliensis]